MENVGKFTQKKIMIEYFLSKFRVTGISMDYLGFALLLCVSDLQQILQKL